MESPDRRFLTVDAIAGLYVEVMRGLQAGLADAGYDLLILAPTKNGQYTTRVLDSSHVLDGLVLMGHRTPGEDLVLLRDGGFPFVTVGRREFGGYTAPYIAPNYTKAFSDMVSYARERGAQKIAAVISFLDDLETSEQPFIQERIAGIYQHGDKDNVTLISSNTKFSEGYASIMAMPELPDALILDSTEFSFGVVMALRDRRVRVPEDVLLVGLDNENFIIRRCEDALNIQMPQWFVPWFDLGTQTAEHMVGCIRSNKVPDVQSYIDFQTRYV